MLECDLQPFQNVRPCLCLFQQILSSAQDNDLSVLDIVEQHLLQIQCLWPIVDKGNHDDTEAVLELCVLIKLI